MEITEEDFWTCFKPIKNLVAHQPNGFQDCMFEDYGAELAFVEKVAAKAPTKVWTITVEELSLAKPGKMGHVKAGFFPDEALGYLLTEMPTIHPNTFWEY